jgi:hypothetical protein
MKIHLLIISVLFFNFANAETYPLLQPLTRNGDLMKLTQQVGAIADKGQKSEFYRKFAPFFWDENITQDDLKIVKGPVSMIDENLIKLSQDPAVIEHVEQAAKLKYDNYMKSLPANQQILARGKLESGHGQLGFFDNVQKPLVTVQNFSSAPEFNKLLKDLSSERDNLRGWPGENSISRSVAGLDHELEIKLKSGEKIIVYGNASEVMDQMSKYDFSGDPDQIKSITVKKINTAKMEALYNAFNHKNGSVTMFGKFDGKPNFAKLRSFIQQYNFHQKLPDIKNGRVTTARGNLIKGAGKGLVATTLFAAVATAAMANPESEQASQIMKTAPSLSAPKINKVNSNQ